MSLPLITAVAPRWESGLAGSLATSTRVHVVRRCADVAELLGVAGAGGGRVAVVSSDLRGLDRAVVDALHEHGLLVLGVHPPDDETAARTLRRWGLTVVAADARADVLEEALAELLGDGPEGARGAGSRAAAERFSARTAGEGDAAETGAGDVRHGVPEEGAAAADVDPHDRRRPSSTTQEGDDGSSSDAQTAIAHPRGLDVLMSPQTSERSDTVEVEEHPPAEDAGPGTVVVVWGPTGSPGRTTVAVNLAAELADPITPVMLVDADTYGASAAQVLAVLDEVPGVAAAARAADQGTLDRETLARLAPEIRPGLRILTGLPRADRWPEIRDVALADVLEECRHLARFTVVDVAAPLEQDEELSFDTLAPRRNGAALTALDAADRVVVVGTGDPVGLQRLVRGLDLLSACTHAERTVVVTRVRPGPVGPDPGRRIQEALDRFAGAGPVHLVPEDQDALDAALLHGQALVEARPRSAARLAIAELADSLAGRAAATRRERSRSHRWLLGRRVATA